MKKALILITLLVVVLMLSGGCGQNTASEVAEHDQGHEGSDEHGHEHGEELYEWGALFTFAEGTYSMDFQESGDPSMGVVFLLDSGDRDYSDHMAYHIFEYELEEVSAGGSFEVVPEFGYNLILKPQGTTVSFVITEAGDYLVYTEHVPDEFDLVIIDQGGIELEPRDAVEYAEHDHDH